MPNVEYILTVGGPDRCQICGKKFTRGIRLATRGHDPLVAFCMWCLLHALDLCTGFEVARQVQAWIGTKTAWRKIKRTGWTGRVDRT